MAHSAWVGAYAAPPARREAVLANKGNAIVTFRIACLAGLALALTLVAPLRAQIYDPYDADPMDARAATLKQGDSESVVVRKMGQPADRIEETRCMWDRVPCLVYRFDDPHRALFVYFTRSPARRPGWVLSGSLMQNVWNP